MHLVSKGALEMSRFTLLLLLHLNCITACRQFMLYIPRQSCAMVRTAQMAIFGVIFAFCIFIEPRAAHFRPAF